MRKLLFIALAVAAFSGISIPKAKAFDPVTLSLLAPYALPVAEVAGQYAVKGMANAAEGMIDVFKDTFSILYLPLGVVESTVGMPFGFFKDGVNDMVTGAEAPFKLVFSTLMLPVRTLGVMNSKK